MKKWVILLMLFFSLKALAYDPFDDSGIAVHYADNQLSVQAESANLGDVIAKIANALQINLIVTDDIHRNITVHLLALPWQEAFETLLKSQQLSYLQLNNVWIVGLNDTNENHVLQAYTLNYAKAASVADMLNQRNILSETGQASFDERTNTLVIKDSEVVMRAVDVLLKKLDVMLRQVQIEARILNANESFSKALGLSFSAGTDNAQVIVNQQPGSIRFGDIQIGLAKLPKDISLDMFISAAEKDNRTQVLATPKLLTANQQEAVIKQGKEIAFEETSASGATSVRFKEAVLELRVTPQITPEGQVILNLSVKHDVIGKLADNGQPTIDTKAISTQVQVNDGETIVLGGIYSKTDIKQNNSIPVLAKLPLFGRLFQEKTTVDDKEELLIFVTPRVVL